MNGPAPLTLEAADRALLSQGCGPTAEQGSYTCPICKPCGIASALTIHVNGDGPAFSCANGCDGVYGVLQTIASLSTPKGERVDDLAVLRDKLRAPEIKRVIKHGRHGTAYIFELDDGRQVEFDGIGAITSQPRFRAAFLPQMRRNPPRFKTSDWDDVAELIERVAEERDSVATTEDETTGWLAGYVEQASVQRNVDIGNAAEMFTLLGAQRGQLPALIDQQGRLHVRLGELVLWLDRRGGARVTAPQLSARLSRLGFERVRHAARNGDQLRRAWYAVSPPRFVDEVLR